jgi:hypothetical protein
MTIENDLDNREKNMIDEKEPYTCLSETLMLAIDTLNIFETCVLDIEYLLSKLKDKKLLEGKKLLIDGFSILKNRWGNDDENRYKTINYVRQMLLENSRFWEKEEDFMKANNIYYSKILNQEALKCKIR